jgi:hypothetical protein
MPDKRYTKVEEEIIQILDRMDDGPAPRPRPNLRLVKPPRQRRGWSLSPRALMRRFPLAFLLVSFALAIAAIALRDTSSTLATVLAIVAAATFFAPILLGRRPAGGASPIQGKMWRGRDIVVTPQSGESPFDRARQWLDRRRR